MHGTTGAGRAFGGRSGVRKHALGRRGGPPQTQRGVCVCVSVCVCVCVCFVCWRVVVSYVSSSALPFTPDPSFLYVRVCLCVRVCVRQVTLIGDVLLASAFVSYIGAFDFIFRKKLWESTWLPDLVARSIPISDVRSRVGRVEWCERVGRLALRV